MSRAAQQASVESTADSVTTLRAETGSPQPVPKAKRRNGKAWREANLFLRWLSAVGSKIFEADDRFARDRGWQIIQRHGYLSRNYRDPRFDSLVACTACSGRGRNPLKVACPDCDGTGRIVLNPTALSQPNRG